ncbi:MAG: 50S ribosomal protein L32 [Thermoleophilia bacterium]|nr:50S ribosomal protein L32 [Thermoleophilia bacterium]TFG72570.1 MAG: 50S ribosomal protein L32 [Solirubrobacterales bacterium]
MAVPKKRQSSSRRDRRRSHDSIAAPRLNECPQCHSPRLPHRVCPTCGTYRGRDVIEFAEPSLDAPPPSEAE